MSDTVLSNYAQSVKSATGIILWKELDPSCMAEELLAMKAEKYIYNILVMNSLCISQSFGVLEIFELSFQSFPDFHTNHIIIKMSLLPPACLPSSLLPSWTRASCFWRAAFQMTRTAAKGRAALLPRQHINLSVGYERPMFAPCCWQSVWRSYRLQGLQRGTLYFPQNFSFNKYIRKSQLCKHSKLKKQKGHGSSVWIFPGDIQYSYLSSFDLSFRYFLQLSYKLFSQSNAP